MSQLIVVSNRVTLPQSGQAVGGLAVALNDALKDHGGTWLGWNGAQVSDMHPLEFQEQQHDQVTYVTTPLSHTEHQDFYSGFANNTLWPMLHSRPDLMIEDPTQFHIYQQVNQRFAQKIAEIAQEDDIIWVHDYHFLSLAQHCRQLGLKNRIGFFLHIPFNNAVHWQQLHVANTLLTDVLAYDVIGLQTQADQDDCIEVYQTLLNTAIKHNTIFYQQRRVLVQAYPIGIDPHAIQQAAKGDSLLLQDYFDPIPKHNVPWIISAERVDYSKGILERLNAIESWIKEQGADRFAAIQVACPCRMEVETYKNLYNSVNQRIALINQEVSCLEHQPIYVTNQMIPHHQLMQLYRQSAVCWVNSLKDGMNLVAKEYIAAQDPDNPGVLILSCHTGAAEQMQQALIVNPHDIKSLKNALSKALDMPLSERMIRYHALIQDLEVNDIRAWRTSFLADLSHANTGHLHEV